MGFAFYIYVEYVCVCISIVLVSSCAISNDEFKYIMYFYMRTKSINVANSWGENFPTHNDYNIHICI